MVTIGWMVTCTPHGSRKSRLVRSACWGWLDSILGHQVAPQNYGGSTIAIDHVLGG